MTDKRGVREMRGDEERSSSPSTICVLLLLLIPSLSVRSDPLPEHRGRRVEGSPFVFLQEHPLPEEHHPLEPHHRLHPEERHLVRRPVDHEPRRARK